MDVQERQAHFKHKPRFLSPGQRPKPILPRTKRRPNSKVAMSRRASALEAFRHNPTDAYRYLMRKRGGEREQFWPQKLVLRTGVLPM